MLVTRAIRESERSLFPLYAFTLGLAVVLSPSNAAAVVLFAYAAGTAGYLERTTVAAWLIGVVVATASVEAWLVHDLFLFSTGALVASFVGLVNLHFATYRRASLALQRANVEIERLAAVAERERIARDLHDVLGHTLSLVAIKADLAARLAEHAAPEAAAESRDVRDAARGALAEIRRVVSGYRTRLVDEVGRARALLEAARVDADITVDATELPAVDEAVFAFALREGVTRTSFAMPRQSAASFACDRTATFEFSKSRTMASVSSAGKATDSRACGSARAPSTERGGIVGGRRNVASGGDSVP